jgi:hypothetical protein
VETQEYDTGAYTFTAYNFHYSLGVFQEYSKSVTLLLHCCYTVVLHCCHTVVTLLLHCGVARLESDSSSSFIL